MSPKIALRPLTILVLFTSFFVGCLPLQSASRISTSKPPLQTGTLLPSSSPVPASPPPDLSNYAFPESFDPAKRYLFYLHGKIIEDQSLPAVSPEFGEYEYLPILESLGGYGCEVISELRAKNTESFNYAEKVARQVTALLNAGVPAENITIVGASKGAAIAIIVSHLLENGGINYVILGGCHPDTVAELVQDGVSLHGNVLSIYDSLDEYAGSCQELFALSEGKGLSKHDEVILEVGTGHGVLYQPLDEWLVPVIQWAGDP